MLKWLTRAARELNWARRAWSTDKDRQFHDELYRSDHYDPFSPAYPGYITIRRFADLVEPHLPVRGDVVDVGCGPAEITCELAARRSDLAFLGIDHSGAAIEKAHANARARGLLNARFETMNVEQYAPGHHIGLLTLFDSFHHLTSPATFVRRLSPHVGRWALIEPRGSWAGTWQKDIDLDWIAHDLDKIRARIEAAAGEADAKAPTGAQAPAPPAPAAEAGAAAVERRYTLDDFRSFFNGFTLDVRGTVAGLERYPPGFRLPGELRDAFGELGYWMYREIDDWLLRKDRDLLAKHWLVVAERGGRARTVDVSQLLPGQDVSTGIAGQYDVRYGNYRGPRSARPGERVIAEIELTNDGWQTWSTEDHHIFTSYHWLDSEGRIVEFDGDRTPLPRPIPAGTSCAVSLRVTAPSRAGRYRLAIDLVREGVTWFSEAGHPWLVTDFEVRS